MDAYSCNLWNLRSLYQKRLIRIKNNFSMKNELFLVLHDIRSAYNVGAIFRTADGAGVKKIYLSGYTCTPSENKINVTKAEKMIAKTALGAEKNVDWEKIDEPLSLAEKLKKEGVKIVSLEETKKSVDFRKSKSDFPIILFLGNEIRGVAEEILKISDEVISIPMRGEKESLNVSVAAGIAIYEILK